MNGCDSQWPVKGDCSGHGTCVVVDGAGTADAFAYCECDDGWTSRGDLLGTACATNLTALYTLWGIALALLVPLVVFSWYTLVLVCRRTLTAPASSVAPITAAAAAGSFCTRLANSVPFRVAFVAALNTPCLAAVAVLKLTRNEMSGLTPANTALQAVVTFSLWAGACSALSGFVNVNLKLVALEADFSGADRERIATQLMRLRVLLYGALLLMSGCVACPFAIYGLNSATTRDDDGRGHHQLGAGTTADTLAIVFCVTQCCSSLAAMAALRFVFARLIAILRSGGIPGAGSGDGGGGAASPRTRPAAAGAPRSSTSGVQPLVPQRIVVTAPASARGAPTASPLLLPAASPMAATRVALHNPVPPASPKTTANGGSGGGGGSANAPVNVHVSTVHAKRSPRPGSAAVGSGGAAATTTTPATSRLAFAAEMEIAYVRLWRIFRNQVLTYTVLAAWPLLRTCIVYLMPLLSTAAVVGESGTLWYLTAPLRVRPNART